ncbi:MBL fold metallo-hydrolase [Amycolatopsis rhabdoformis]|uniref:MBL fold metallo-hydrolase n=1 Tax=Amycolatopsis rhabdoformis TaxID=1448059 RepID=A0ABZ1IJT7_9PSEU|nr:MBL fold metallo-hydrolase [Amycolatopsis rhabdoformis]WSE34677.1 MBL fold metallo-hydrolase [Amycolatopsis rhabdoformis]
MPDSTDFVSTEVTFSGDPVALRPVDEIRITTLVDNVYDGLLEDGPFTTRETFGRASEPSPQFEGGRTEVGLLGEHGFSSLVTVRRGTEETTLLFDTGLAPRTMVTNAERLGVDLHAVTGVVLSHGHFDHTGGLAGLLDLLDRRRLPVLVHPSVWTRRRTTAPGQAVFELPTLSKTALADEGCAVIERRDPSLLADDCVLITGEVPRTTEFEKGMPPFHQAWVDGAWHHDPAVIDDQALVVNLRGQGLVVLTGCGHAGVLNIVKHAQRLTGVERLHALVGGLHLGGRSFEPTIAPTVAALAALSPTLVAPGHCTGWRAQQALATAFPAAWVPSSSGSTHRLVGA